MAQPEEGASPSKLLRSFAATAIEVKENVKLGKSSKKQGRIIKVSICKDDVQEDGSLSRERKTAKTDKGSGRWVFIQFLKSVSFAAFSDRNMKQNCAFTGLQQAKWERMSSERWVIYTGFNIFLYSCVSGL